jgi:hypothetical protein
MGLKNYELAEVKLEITDMNRTIKYLLRSDPILRNNS